MRHNASHLGYFFSEGFCKANRFFERFCILNRIYQKTDAFCAFFLRFGIKSKFIFRFGDLDASRFLDNSEDGRMECSHCVGGVLDKGRALEEMIEALNRMGGIAAHLDGEHLFLVLRVECADCGESTLCQHEISGK